MILYRFIIIVRTVSDQIDLKIANVHDRMFSQIFLILLVLIIYVEVIGKSNIKLSTATCDWPSTNHS